MTFKHAGKGLILLLAVLLIAPWLVPTASYKAQLEQLASAELGAPVSIDGVRVALLPSPRVNVSGIVVGQESVITIKGIDAVLDMTTLFRPVRVLSRLEIDQPVIKSAGIDILAPLFNKKDAQTVVAIRKVEVSLARLDLNGPAFPRMNASIAMSDNGRFSQATLVSEDQKLRMLIKPVAQGYQANLDIAQWRPPVGPPVLIDTLSARLLYSRSVLNVPEVEATLYGGKLTASAHLDWTRDWQLKGKFRTDAIELADMTRVFSKTVTVSGRISGNGNFSGSAGSVVQLGDKLMLDYTFNVEKGVLHGMDLAKAASLFLKQTGQGGETQFDELSGRLHIAGKQIDLRNLKTASGLLAAEGNIRVSPARALDGQVDVELKKGLALVTVPLKVSGTIDAPVIMPTKSAIAGAAAV